MSLFYYENYNLYVIIATGGTLMLFSTSASDTELIDLKLRNKNLTSSANLLGDN